MANNFTSGAHEGVVRERNNLVTRKEMAACEELPLAQANAVEIIDDGQNTTDSSVASMFCA